MSGIFISYRRDDSAEIAHRLYGELGSRFDVNSVFIDVENIEPGEDFAEVIDEKVGFCDALIAVIGKNWVTSAHSDGRRRLDDPQDWVRLEIGAALSRGIKVIPVLVDNASLPDRRDLPAALSMLTQSQALDLRADRFDDGLNRLVAALATVQRGISATNLWFAIITRGHRALDPLDLHKPEVVRRALGFLLSMTTLEGIIRLPSAAVSSPASSKIGYLLADVSANCVQFLGAGFILHFVMKALGGKAKLQRSIAAFCFLTAYLPLIAIAQVPVWGLNVSILTDAADIHWRLTQGIDRMRAFAQDLGSLGVLRVVVAFGVSTFLWFRFFAAIFQAFRSLHRLGKVAALLALAVGMIAIVAFVSVVVTPYFGTVYKQFGRS